MGHTAFWLLAALCTVLLGCLYWALHRLYFLELKTSAPAESGTASDVKAAPTHPAALTLENLRRVVPSLQEYGISQADTTGRAEFCKAFLDQAVRAAAARRGWIWIWDDDKAVLQQAAASESDGNRSPEGREMVDKAFKETRAVFDSSRSERVQAAWPLMAKSNPFGVLHLELGAPPDEMLEIQMILLASEAAVILNQLQRFDHLQRFHIEMVETLYRTVNARDSQSSDNAELTRRRAHQLAVGLGLTDAMARHVEYAALLRGVGKIGIDQALLNKPGKLTAEEYEKIKKYTAIGAQILARVKLLAPAAIMVLHHQEWFDGRGYPEGLKGEQIPLGARIIAVISAWEAMTANRPYRKALTTEDALAELQRAAGTQFDPNVVAAFRKIEEKRAAARS